MDLLVLRLFEKLQSRAWKIVTAESCTGGLICERLTSVAGSSVYVDRGFITYSNQSKIEMLNVSPVLIDDYGAVSAQVAESMALGALNASDADIAVSVTGIAGPGGGSDDKPVGLVYIGVATWEKTQSFEYRFKGDRAVIRAQACDAALERVFEVS